MLKIKNCNLYSLKLDEITQIYLDNIKVIKGKHRKKRLCFDKVVEPERTDKH